MTRKPIPETIKKQIITLKASGSKTAEIMQVTGLSKATVENYVKKYRMEIERLREENAEIKDVMPKNVDKKTPKKEPDKKASPKNEEKPKYAAVEEETTKSTIRKTADSVSSLKAKEITEDYKAAQMLHSASVRYQKNIEMMGLEWDRFIAFAVDDAYERAVNAYKEKVEEQLREASLLEMAITEELENPKTEDGMMMEEQEE
ncbi:MAG: helix-turn-helix domain-containing protein [Candidatus Thermoplasmatota archaeon]|nr:helix-turn-helix domain-containing protein [Candidatus Thermoplasmatota archaeon]